jgi:hypothetical protein
MTKYYIFTDITPRATNTPAPEKAKGRRDDFWNRLSPSTPSNPSPTSTQWQLQSRTNNRKSDPVNHLQNTTTPQQQHTIPSSSSSTSTSTQIDINNSNMPQFHTTNTTHPNLHTLSQTINSSNIIDIVTYNHQQYIIQSESLDELLAIGLERENQQIHQQQFNFQ